ncbi:hypothetical protein HDU86_008002 [Geranomyces michiganensis]|nr:hypothetical protein HDU86_008002 [Geranomyces michiganensis]
MLEAHAIAEGVAVSKEEVDDSEKVVVGSEAETVEVSSVVTDNATELSNVDKIDKVDKADADDVSVVPRTCHRHQGKRKEQDLFNRIKIFAFDLLTFGKDAGARERLESQPDVPLYVSSAYFTPAEVDRILSFPSATGLTLQQTLEAVIADKTSAAQSGASRDYELCTSHDLAPVVCAHFGIRKGFQEEKAFTAALKAFKKSWRKSSRK